MATGGTRSHRPRGEHPPRPGFAGGAWRPGPDRRRLPGDTVTPAGGAGPGGLGEDRAGAAARPGPARHPHPRRPRSGDLQHGVVAPRRLAGGLAGRPTGPRPPRSRRGGPRLAGSRRRTGRGVVDPARPGRLRRARRRPPPCRTAGAVGHHDAAGADQSHRRVHRRGDGHPRRAPGGGGRADRSGRGRRRGLPAPCGRQAGGPGHDVGFGVAPAAVRSGQPGRGQPGPGADDPADGRPRPRRLQRRRRPRPRDPAGHRAVRRHRGRGGPPPGELRPVGLPGAARRPAPRASPRLDSRAGRTLAGSPGRAPAATRHDRPRLVGAGHHHAPLVARPDDRGPGRTGLRDRHRHREHPRGPGRHLTGAGVRAAPRARGGAPARVGGRPGVRGDVLDRRQPPRGSGPRRSASGSSVAPGPCAATSPTGSRWA